MLLRKEGTGTVGANLEWIVKLETKNEWQKHKHKLKKKITFIWIITKTLNEWTYVEVPGQVSFF